MTPLQKMERARTHLILDYPLYGLHILPIKLIEDISVERASTNGVIIKFNPEFIDTLNNKKVIFLLAHEAKHIMNGHHIRRGWRDVTKFNMATDYVINLELVSEGFEPIDNILLSEDYRDMSSEMVYGKREEENNKRAKEEDSDNNSKNPPASTDGGKGDSNTSSEEGGNAIGEKENSDDKSWDIGGVEDAPPDIDPIEEEERIREQTHQAIHHAKMAGKLPAGLERAITEKLRPKAPWERLLINWFTEKFNNDYSWMERDPRVRDWRFPSLINEEPGLIILAIDTSGSIDYTMINHGVSEISILKMRYKFECVVLGCDASIHYMRRYRKEEPIKIESLGGGGGTSFYPVWEWIKKSHERPIGVVYFTDMYGSFGERPPYDVLWLSYGGTYAPFGKVVKLEVK